jgi:GNAT superfamily N-acetyltransferase
MNIPDLPPDMEFRLLPRDEDALRYSFEAKRAAMGPYIIERWGWDEDYQLRTHRSNFEQKPFFRISRAGADIGTLSLMNCGAFIRFGEFYLFPQHQRAGTGTKILAHCIALADRQAMPMRLEHLKWNPVGSLYRRVGFEVIGETDIHYLMERKPQASSVK